MKTNLFIAALSLVVLAGCSGEDEIGTLVAKNDNAINFELMWGNRRRPVLWMTPNYKQRDSML